MTISWSPEAESEAFYRPSGIIRPPPSLPAQTSDPPMTGGGRYLVPVLRTPSSSLVLPCPERSTVLNPAWVTRSLAAREALRGPIARGNPCPITRLAEPVPRDVPLVGAM